MCKLREHLTGALDRKGTHPSLFCCCIVYGTQLPQHTAEAPAVLRNLPVGCVKSNALSLLDRYHQFAPSVLRSTCHLRREARTGRCCSQLFSVSKGLTSSLPAVKRAQPYSPCAQCSASAESSGGEGCALAAELPRMCSKAARGLAAALRC